MVRLISANTPLLAAIIKKRVLATLHIPTTIEGSPGACVVEPNYNPFEDLKVGTPFGLYDEPIVKIDVLDRAARAPKWFDPKGNPGHLAVHSPTKKSAYIALAVDKKKRAAAHPFDLYIKANAISTPIQARLF
jgi:hypothetical protein